MNDFIAIAIAIASALTVLITAYGKGRKDKTNENKADDLEVMQDVKERSDSIDSSSDDELIKRMRDAER